MLHVNKLNFSYDSEPVLNQISLHWKPGELISIIGENGSGKSTLIKLLCGINKTKENCITINGVILNSISLKNRAKLISYIPQNSTIDCDIKVYDFILMGRKPWFQWRESAEDCKKVIRILERFNIETLALRKMGDLSGGERQKVHIARSLVQDTPIIILDEPTNNLDIRFQVELMKILKKECHDNNKLIAMAVHDINLALRYSSDVLLLKKGTIVSSGSVHTALNEQTIRSAMDINNEIIDHRGIKIMIPV